MNTEITTQAEKVLIARKEENRLWFARKQHVPHTLEWDANEEAFEHAAIITQLEERALVNLVLSALFKTDQF